VLPERKSHRSRSLVQRPILDVAVDVHGGRDFGMAQDSRDDVHRRPVLEHDRAGRVAEVVEPDPWQALALQECTELARHVGRVEW